MAVPQTARAYQERRLAEHACKEAVAYLREQSWRPSHTILSQQPEVWRDLYPWLRASMTSESSMDTAPTVSQRKVILEQMETFARNQEFWWIERTDTPFSGTSPEGIRERWFAKPNVQVLEEQILGACLLYRVIQIEPEQPRGVVNVRGGPIQFGPCGNKQPGTRRGHSIGAILAKHGAG